MGLCFSPFLACIVAPIIRSTRSSAATRSFEVCSFYQVLHPAPQSWHSLLADYTQKKRIGGGVEPLAHSVTSEASNHLVDQLAVDR